MPMEELLADAPPESRSSIVARAPYTALARRYRSRDFEEVVGQEPIVQTLRNAVRSGRTAHAYLFCGTRGVGKTSMARILARAINVPPELTQADQIAQAILRGDDLDVIEIDGASNRGVQEARDLIAAAGMSPARCPYKIYIIDEVHMLTKEAFNTLLKTMEEPPPHVKFILCTTEPNKVPATIHSRCQRFEFRALTASQIATHLARVLENEGVEADPEVVAQVAAMGRGSMRDALSLLDRLLAAGEQRLAPELLERMLGLPDRALIGRIVDFIAEGSAKGALESGGALLSRGASIEGALELLIEHLRALLVVAACGADSDLLEVSTAARKALARQAEGFDTAGLVHLIALADATMRNTRFSAVARALFDAMLVRMCQAERLADIAALLEGAAGARAGAAGASGAAPKKKDLLIVPQAQPVRAAADPPERAVPAPPRRGASGAPAATGAGPGGAPESLAGKPRAGRRPGEATPGPEGQPPSTHGCPEEARHLPPQPAGAPGDSCLRIEPGRPPGGVAPLWDALTAYAARSPADNARMESLRPVSFDGRTLRLRVEGDAPGLARWHAARPGDLEELVRRATGIPVAVELVGADDARGPRRTAARLDQARQIPQVRAAMEIFDAAVVEVEDVPASGGEGGDHDD
jgi:DNA polymerase-3 subunit gamma/tau